MMAFRRRSGPAPYAMVGGVHDDHRPDPDHPERVALVRELFRRAADRERGPAIAAALDATGVPPTAGGSWQLGTLYHMLDNPAYEPLVEPETWHRVREQRGAGRIAPRKKAAESWLEGSVVHGCGKPMGLTGWKRSTGRRQEAFRCNNRGCAVRPAEVARGKLEGMALAALRGEPRAAEAARLIAAGVGSEAQRSLIRAGAEVVVRDGGAVEVEWRA